MDIKYEDFRLLGDIYISIDKCYEQALEYGHSNVREICFLATHGILHLLGYDHMEKEDEDKVISYTDITGLLMSSVSTIVDSVTYVLIAFVSISLIVSSIMIGVITLISG